MRSFWQPVTSACQSGRFFLAIQGPSWSKWPSLGYEQPRVDARRALLCSISGRCWSFERCQRNEPGHEPRFARFPGFEAWATTMGSFFRLRLSWSHGFRDTERHLKSIRRRAEGLELTFWGMSCFLLLFSSASIARRWGLCGLGQLKQGAHCTGHVDASL